MRATVPLLVVALAAVAVAAAAAAADATGGKKFPREICVTKCREREEYSPWACRGCGERERLPVDKCTPTPADGGYQRNTSYYVAPWLHRSEITISRYPQLKCYGRIVLTNYRPGRCEDGWTSPYTVVDFC
jgi:hypothetical protein